MPSREFSHTKAALRYGRIKTAVSPKFTYLLTLDTIIRGKLSSGYC